MSPEPDQREGGRTSTCTPCRGTGRLISTLGGESHEIVCPWCDGKGEFIPGSDAQASPSEQAPRPGPQV